MACRTWSLGHRHDNANHTVIGLSTSHRLNHCFNKMTLRNPRKQMAIISRVLKRHTGMSGSCFAFFFLSHRLIILEITFYFIFLLHEEIHVVLAGWAELPRMLAVVGTWRQESSGLEGERTIKTQPQTRGIRSSGIQNIQGGYLVAPQIHKYVIGFTSRQQKHMCAIGRGGRECSGGCGIKTMTKTGKAPSCSPGTGSFRERTVLSGHSLTIRDTSKGQFPGCHTPL